MMMISMKNIFLVLVLCLISSTILSQEITLVASNNVGDSQVLHTLKLSSNNSEIIYNDDANIASSLNKKIQSFIEYVENKNGVLRITFDKATNSFSILSDLKFNIQDIINTNTPLNTTIE